MVVLQDGRERPDQAGADRLSAEPAESQRERHRAPHVGLELHPLQGYLQPRKPRRGVPPKREPRLVAFDQDRFQARGCKAHGLDVPGVFASIESTPHHGILLWGVADDTAKAADALVFTWLSQIGRCRASGAWPSYNLGLMMIDAPLWWLKRFSEGTDRR